MIHLQDETMAKYSTFRIGGVAGDVYFPESLEEFREIYDDGFIVIGNGSNVLFGDGVIKRPIIVTTKMNGFNIENVQIVAECGVMIARLAHEVAKIGLSGLEFAGGIPATVGGAVYMNAGAHGGEMNDVVVSSQLLVVSDRKTDGGRIVTLDNEGHGFGYRKSVFQETGNIVLETTLQLEKGDGEEITKKMKENLDKRRASQPLDFPSVGSIFKKVEGKSAGEIIDKCGLKGKTIGGAQVSPKHAGFIVNMGGATATDVLDLITAVKEEVWRQKEIELEEEIQVISNSE